MVKIIVNCKSCGKEIKLDFNDSRALCKKCRKNTTTNDKKTSRNFDF
ncbi:MAG: hypothetical protein ACFE9S_00020 [Candidatus Hermodarchaeota archaeon]